MGKYLLTNAVVRVHGVDLSNHAYSLDTPESADQVDVSGFNPDRVREFLAGLIDQTVTIGFLQDFAANSVHATLEPLFTNATIFHLWIVPDGSASISATNPAFGGQASMYEYNGLSGQLNARGEITATFKPASGTKLGWVTTDPNLTTP